MTNTALSAKAKQIAQNVTFRDDEHRKFFLPICQNADMAMSTMWHWCIAWGLMRTQGEMSRQFMTLRQGVSKRSAYIMAGLQAEAQE